MSSTEPNHGAPIARPHTLSASSLCRRAALGLAILFTGTFISAWLYDTSIKANASTPTAAVQTAPTGPIADPVGILRSRHADNR